MLVYVCWLAEIKLELNTEKLNEKKKKTCEKYELGTGKSWEIRQIIL